MSEKGKGYIFREVYKKGKATLLDALKLVNRLEQNYIIDIKRKFFELTKKEKSQIEWFPKTVIISTIFVPDDLIGKRALDRIEESLSSKENENNNLMIIVTNIQKFDEPLHFLDKNKVFITANNIDQMYIRVSDLFDLMEREYYENLKISE